MPELHLRQPGFTYSACGLFTKHLERIQKFGETENLKHIYKNDLDKAWFDHDVAYSENKDLAKRTVPDKTLKERVYKIVINSKYNGYQRGLASMVYTFFDKKARSGAKTSVNEELAQELHKPLQKECQECKI